MYYEDKMSTFDILFKNHNEMNANLEDRWCVRSAVLVSQALSALKISPQRLGKRLKYCKCLCGSVSFIRKCIQ